MGCSCLFSRRTYTWRRRALQANVSSEKVACHNLSPRYTATGVVSSVSAADYLKCSPMFSSIESACSSDAGSFSTCHGLDCRTPDTEVPTAICILGFFAGCMLMGMQEVCKARFVTSHVVTAQESSAVASMLFVFHLPLAERSWKKYLWSVHILKWQCLNFGEVGFLYPWDI